MFGLFKKKGRSSPMTGGWIVAGIWIDKQQRQLANYLQAKMQKLSAKMQACVIMGICLTFSLLSLSIFYAGTKNKSGASIKYPPLQQLKIDTIIK